MIFVDVFFILSFLMFLFYFIIISIFGYLIYITLSKKQIKERVTLSNILIYFAVGVSIHLIYSMIIVSFRIFNLFSALIPFIIIDISFLVYVFKKKEINLENLKNLVESLKKSYSKILLLIIILVMLYLLQINFIWKSVALPSSDPYFWFENIWFVHENGYIDYNLIETYPPGYVLFCASIISFTDDYYLIYFFCKYIPIFLSIINILVLFELTKSFFKRKIHIFFALVIYMSFNYLAYRYTMLLPSTLATTLGFLFLIVFKKKNNHTILKVKGLIIAGIFMAHPLYGLYYLIFFFLYDFILLIYDLSSKENKGKRYIFHKREVLYFFNKKRLVKDFFSHHLYILLIVLIMLCPFFILTSIFIEYSIFEYYFNFIKPNLYLFNSFGWVFKIDEFFIKIMGIFKRSIIFNFLGEFNSKLFNLENIPILDSIINETLGFGIILVFLGIFLPLNKFLKLKQEEQNLIGFIKFTFILTCISYLSLFLTANLLKTYFFGRTIEFFSYFFKRYFELFAGYWAIIFILTFNFLALYFNKLIKKILIKLKSFRNKIHQFHRFFLINYYTLIILTGFFFYSSNFNRIYYYQNFSEDHTYAILFAGNYFNENQLTEDTIILIEEVFYSYDLQVSNYDLINFKKLIKIYFNFSFIVNYIIFQTYYPNKKYALFNNKNTNEEFIINFTADFEILYENNGGWLFAKSRS